MRSFVISALSRPRETSSRSVFMFTGITACTIGSTRAPPFSTTCWPPRPVRTNARSFEERRYSQCRSHMTIATTIAMPIRARMKAPNCAPLMLVPSVGRSTSNGLEAPGGVGQGDLGRQPLHAGGAVEAVAGRTLLQDVGGVLGGGDGPAVAEHDHVLLHLAGRLRPAVDARRAVGQRQRGGGADGAPGREAHVADHDVGAGAGHLARLGLREDVRR